MALGRWVLLFSLLGGISSEAIARAIPDLTGPVVDETGILTPEEVVNLEGRILEHKEQTGQQFAILMIPSLEGAVLESFSMEVVEKWQLGSDKEDNGLLILLAMDDRKMRIEVGYGLEGVHPGCLRQASDLRHHETGFQKGGVRGGTRGGPYCAGCGRPGGEAPALPTQSNPDFDGDNLGFFLIIFFLIGFFMLRAVLKGSGNRSSGSRSSSSSSPSYSFFLVLLQ